MSLKTVSLIVLCDEIAAEVPHPHNVIQELHNLQFDIHKLSIIPENEKAIYTEIKLINQQSDFLIIIRGSSTKNWTVYKALGRLFAKELVPNPQLVKILDTLNVSYSTTEVATPKTVKLISSGKRYPVIHQQRIFVLNDVSSFVVLENYLSHYRQKPFYRKIVKINRNGNSGFSSEDVDQLAVGSDVMVKFRKEDHFLVFEISSSQIASVVKFENKVREIFKAYNFFVEEDSICWQDIYSADDVLVQNTLEDIEKCLLKYGGPENVFVCFNGGKDCTVLLYLVLVVIKKQYPNYSGSVFCLYVQSENPFPEQDEFISVYQRYYNLEIMTIRSGIKDALEQVLSRSPNYKACFMGTRRTDPFSNNLKTFQMTDSDWPEIMRVSPILDWHYSDIWDFLLYHKVPYCKLYDLGFTSLGNTINTVKNPSLIYYDGWDEEEKYLPAYKLFLETKERNGRETR